MSRRRAQKEQEKEDFLEQNPELQRYTTRIEVVEVEDGSSDSSSDSFSDDGWDSEIVEYEAEATRDGEAVYSDTDTDVVLPSLTLADDVSIDGGTLRARSGEEDDEDLYLSLSENGFGAAAEPELDFGYLDTYEHSPSEMMPNSQDFALDGDEQLVFYSRDERKSDFGPESEIGPDYELGATEFGIDFTVLSGRGTVELMLVDYSEDERYPDTVQATSAFLRSGQDGSLEVEMPEGTYDRAYVSVTGSLEIAVVGIDVTSNTEFSGSIA